MFFMRNVFVCFANSFTIYATKISIRKSVHSSNTVPSPAASPFSVVVVALYVCHFPVVIPDTAAPVAASQVTPFRAPVLVSLWLDFSFFLNFFLSPQFAGLYFRSLTSRPIGVVVVRYSATGTGKRR
uniref:Putative secreted protein n=1 Tax=Anopheles triannulatus TaxID=58253 RepID=A0A2M4B6P7_9DIPT